MSIKIFMYMYQMRHLLFINMLPSLGKICKYEWTSWPLELWLLLNIVQYGQLYITSNTYWISLNLYSWRHFCQSLLLIIYL